MKKEYLTTSPFQTKKLGQFLAKKILKSGQKNKAIIIGLEGDLGSGKTTFLQGFAKGLGIKKRILSPTFIIMRRFKNFYHIDCYRIQKSKELLTLGFKEIIDNPKNVVAIEWAEKIKKLLPKSAIVIRFNIIGQKNRKIMFLNLKK